MLRKGEESQAAADLALPHPPGLPPRRGLLEGPRQHSASCYLPGMQQERVEGVEGKEEPENTHPPCLPDSAPNGPSVADTTFLRGPQASPGVRNLGRQS